MNQLQFENKIQDLISGSPVNLKFLTEWYENTLNQLESFKKQTSGIEHPRYRGDERESEFKKLLEGILPSSILISNGFAINEYATKSYEQDCLILDRNRTATFLKTDTTTYFPIESILGSVEIKSKLTLKELRRTILNCVSLKKLAFNNAFSEEEYKKEPNVKIAYAIFAYDSGWTLKKTADEINKLLDSVPATLRPNMFFLLNKGLIMPCRESAFALGPDQLFTGDNFAGQGAMGTKTLPKSLATPFLWYLSNIIDHSIQEMDSRDAPWYGKYVFGPIHFQTWAEKLIEKRSKGS